MPQDPVLLNPDWAAERGPDGGFFPASAPTAPIPVIPGGRDLGSRRDRPTRSRGPQIVAVTAVVLVAVGSGAFVLPRLTGNSPVAQLSPSSSDKTAGTTPGRAAAITPSPSATQAAAGLVLAKKKTLPGDDLPWPDSGQAMVQVAGLGTVGHSGSTRAVPIASVTKVMTAYTVLRDHPLAAGQSGPTITVTALEAAAYPAQKAAGLSLVKVAPAEKITERQALQALLLASGDNMAEILARWDAGSQSAFVQKMNANARRLGMTSTHYADAAGLNAASVSTAKDLLKLAPVAMAETTFAEVVGESTATIPLNKIRNYNYLVGRDGVVGIKTGSTSAAGGCLLFAARHTVSGHTYTIYGALLGIAGSYSTILPNALSASAALISATERGLRKTTLIRAGDAVASMANADGTTTTFTVEHSYSVTGWAGLKYRFSLPAGLRPGQAPTKLTVHTPKKTLSLNLVAQQ
jgi:serine-type D-Ala-D-Ala carboxypeptidase (penicillin-binding protein 5/6)